MLRRIEDPSFVEGTLLRLNLSPIYLGHNPLQQYGRQRTEEMRYQRMIEISEQQLLVKHTNLTIRLARELIANVETHQLNLFLCPTPLTLQALH
jgi:hypothetical protein